MWIRGGEPYNTAIVLFRSVGAAKTAFESLDGTEVDGKPIKLSSPAARRAAAAAAAAVHAPNEPTEVASAKLAAKSNKQSGSRGPMPRRPRADESEEGMVEAEETPEVQETTPKSSRKTRKARNQKRNGPSGPSQTMLFVSHLSYSVRDKDLMEHFREYPVLSAQVVYHRQNPRHSRGFAFVNFATHEAQLKALEEKNESELAGRKMKVAGTHLHLCTC